MMNYKNLEIFDTNEIEILQDFPEKVLNDGDYYCAVYNNLKGYPDFNTIRQIREGETFLSDTKHRQTYCRLGEDLNGNTRLEELYSYNKETKNLEYKVSNKDIIQAKLLSIGTDNITAEIYYDDHEEEGIFNEIFKDALEEAGLLIPGKLFEIVTERHKCGFSVDVQPFKNKLDNEDTIFHNEIMKAKHYIC